jgi:hypothetical protein
MSLIKMTLIKAGDRVRDWSRARRPVSGPALLLRFDELEIQEGEWL